MYGICQDNIAQKGVSHREMFSIFNGGKKFLEVTICFYRAINGGNNVWEIRLATDERQKIRSERTMKDSNPPTTRAVVCLIYRPD